uniref:PPPDE domain-containing protein n=1 Tax=Aegilops tauschii subsp. strangulata TaxID=200361 RepID=A0A453CQ20_AEGTS
MAAQNGGGGGAGAGAAVVLNVYDLTPINDYLYWFGLGIFHSGIEGFDS